MAEPGTTTNHAPGKLAVKLKISGHVSNPKEFVSQLDRLCQQFTRGRVVCSLSPKSTGEPNATA